MLFWCLFFDHVWFVFRCFMIIGCSCVFFLLDGIGEE
jgi:hypothetical protein